MIKLGSFKFAGKTHNQNKEGVDTFRLKFEDEEENRISLKCDEMDFDNYSEGDFYDLAKAIRQDTL